jgi:hypothetical protein
MLTVKQIDAAKLRRNHIASQTQEDFFFVPPTGKGVANAIPVRRKRKNAGHWPISLNLLTEARAKQAHAKIRLLSGIDPAKSSAKKIREEIRSH